MNASRIPRTGGKNTLSAASQAGRGWQQQQARSQCWPTALPGSGKGLQATVLDHGVPQGCMGQIVEGTEGLNPRIGSEGFWVPGGDSHSTLCQ